MSLVMERPSVLYRDPWLGSRRSLYIITHTYNIFVYIYNDTFEWLMVYDLESLAFPSPRPRIQQGSFYIRIIHRSLLAPSHHHQPTIIPNSLLSLADGDRLFANQQESFWHNVFVATKKIIYDSVIIIIIITVLYMVISLFIGLRNSHENIN